MDIAFDCLHSTVWSDVLLLLLGMHCKPLTAKVTKVGKRKATTAEAAMTNKVNRVQNDHVEHGSVFLQAVGIVIFAKQIPIHLGSRISRVGGKMPCYEG